MNLYSTPRLYLRTWRDSDMIPFAAINADARVMRYFPAVLSQAQSHALAERIRSQMARDGYGLWIVEAKDSGEVIGIVGLQQVDLTLPFAPAVEIAWRLAWRFQGQGIATEAAARVLQIAEPDFGLSSIIAFTASVNKPSQRVMEKIGMHYERDFAHPRLPVNDPLSLHCLYRFSATSSFKTIRPDGAK